VKAGKGEGSETQEESLSPQAEGSETQGELGEERVEELVEERAEEHPRWR
jgi:hypothetical protein